VQNFGAFGANKPLKTKAYFLQSSPCGQINVDRAIADICEQIQQVSNILESVFLKIAILQYIVKFD
jgi:hypothetical protein